MPNPLIYASTTPNHSLHKGGVAVGVNSVEYNPSDGWINGAIPTDWDYVIYKTTSGAIPNIFAPANEQEFYNFVLMQGGSSSDVTSVGAALAWIATQSDLLALHSSLPNIVTDGLILALDAGDVSSYPTTGTTWYDACGQGNDSTLINGIDFNLNGWMELDSTDEYIDIGPATNFLPLEYHSLEIMVKSSGLGAGMNSGALFGLTYGIIIQILSGGSLSYYVYNTDNGSSTYLFSKSSTGVNLFDNKWHHIVCLRNSSNAEIYIDGELNSSGGNGGTWSGTNIWASMNGRIGDNPNNVSYNLFGSLNSPRIYNKALSSSEILQNYYQAPIVTDGLVFAVDAGNLVSYEPGSNVAYNLTGSNISTFYNGLQYNPDNGGYFLSDGVDDALHTSDASNLDLDEFTLEGWVWWNQHKNYGSLLVKGPGGSGNIFNYCFFFYSGNIVCGFGNGGAFYNVSISTPTTNEWHHIVGTYDGATLKFYLDGTLANSSTVAQTPYQNNNDLQIIQASYPIDGRVAASRIYNRALTADEVSQNFQAQSSRFI
tara:strand:- start:310 stop:1932 length:1623 start_codon:yes stop_codon:yes gene_type:complete